MEQQQPKQSKTSTIILTILLILSLLGGAGGIYYFYNLAKTAKAERQNLKTQVDILNKQLEEQKKMTQDCTKPTSKTSSSCSSTLTAAEKEEIATWKTLENKTYKYTLKYPATWKLTKTSDDEIDLKSDEASVDFQIRSGDMSAFGLESFTKKDSKDINIACVSAERVTLTSDEYEMITAIFDKNSIHHVFMITYQDLDASISGDIIDAYDLLLKTVEFND